MHEEKLIRTCRIQRLCVEDGPGVRTTVFLKGCFLACPWCCNPESISFHQDCVFQKGDCVNHKNNVFCQLCEIQGGSQFKTHCPLGIYEKTYVDFTPEQLFEHLIKDTIIYDDGGGITFSGGDPLFQSHSLLPLLELLKFRKINIALETSLYAPENNFQSLFSYVDYWIIDLKFQFGFIPNKSYDYENAFNSNIDFLQHSVASDRVLYRMVVMKELLENIDSVVEKFKKYRIACVELLPYHELGKDKYRQLNKSFHHFTQILDGDMEYIKNIFMKNGIESSNRYI